MAPQALARRFRKTVLPCGRRRPRLGYRGESHLQGGHSLRSDRTKHQFPLSARLLPYPFAKKLVSIAAQGARESKWRSSCQETNVMNDATEETARLSMQEDIPFLTLAQSGILDLTVDGADEVDANLDLIKGYGRARL